MKPGYKQSEVGVIPEDWDAMPLGSAIKLQSGYSFQSINFTDLGVPVIRISDIQDGIVMSNDAVRHPPIKISTDFVITRGDVLVAMSGATTGKVGTYSQDGTAYQNQRVGRFVVRDPKRSFRDYIKHVVSAPTFGAGLAAMLEQGAQPNISGRQIESLLCAFPSKLPEQRAIAEALSDVDGLLGGLDRLIAKRRDLKQAAMQQLLTAQTRLPGFHGEWVERSLGDISELNRRNVIPALHPKETFAHFSLPAFDAGKLPVIEHGDEIGSNKFSVPQNAVLVSKLNPRIPRVWTPDVVPVNSVASMEFLVLTPRPGVERRFLFVVCTSPHFGTELEESATGTTGSHQRVNPADALEIKVHVPCDTAEQTAIAEVLGEMDSELAALERRREKTRALKQAMMQQLLTGQTRLV